MFAYVLRSLKDGNRYTGITLCVAGRVVQHNRGAVKSTRGRRPFELMYKEEFATRVEARSREKYFKTAADRRFLDDLGV
jgi:putative endonuclease